MIRTSPVLEVWPRVPFYLAGLLAVIFWISFLQDLAQGSNDRAVEIIVDANSGSDTNLGTPERPVKTIAQAAEMAMFNRRKGISTKVKIRPGTYREFVQITSVGPEMGASIEFQSPQVGAAILSGSDIWTDWRPDPTNLRIYVHPWQYRWGSCEHPRGWPVIKDVGLRREMIFVNGTPLTQTLSQKDMKAGSFFVDEVNGVVSVWPPAGTSMVTSKIEVAVRPGVFESNAVSNLSIKGLVFEHANSCLSTKPNAAVIISGGTNNLMEDAAILWNNWIGFDYWSTTNSMARRLVVNWNGEMGINGYRLKNATFENVETSHNNWRGAQGQFTTWEPSGGKFLRTHGATFRNYTAIGNQGRGMWFDTDNIDIVIDHATIEQNLVGGIDIEANLGPVRIQNSRICSNLKEGIQGNQTIDVTLIGNVIYDNDKSEIMVSHSQSPSIGINWETKEAFSSTSDHWVLSQNTIVGSKANQFVFGTVRPPNQGPNTFLSTLKSDDNVWFNPDKPDAFQIDPGAPDRPTQVLNFVQWQSITGQDKHSRFGPPDNDPAALCTAP